MSEIGDAIRAEFSRALAGGEVSKEQGVELLKGFVKRGMPAFHKMARGALTHDRKEHRGFVRRNIQRWREGFDALETLNAVCLAAGQEFQREFLNHPPYVTDTLLGVLMRIHARSCRVSGEILALMRDGYPDGAMSRWRSLHELALTALALNHLGTPAAVDYYVCGKVKELELLHAYQASAEEMGYERHPDDFVRAAVSQVDELLKRNGRTAKDYNGQFGWINPYAEKAKGIDALRKLLGLQKWYHDYKWSSQEVHPVYKEMRTTLGMSEASQDLLLAGPSNSAMTEPGHRSAIALAQATTAFITAYTKDEKSPLDDGATGYWIGLISELCDSVGQAFLACEAKKPKRGLFGKTRWGKANPINK